MSTQPTTPGELRLSPEVARARRDGTPVLALESTIIAHGLPRPRNREVARELEAIAREEGACPATVAVLDGVAHVGLDDDELARVAEDTTLRKLGTRDLPVALALGASGATTVSATAWLAAAAGIRVFATGGLGGVHRGFAETFDESADLGGAEPHPPHRGLSRGEVHPRCPRHPGTPGEPERDRGRASPPPSFPASTSTAPAARSTGPSTRRPRWPG